MAGAWALWVHFVSGDPVPAGAPPHVWLLLGTVFVALGVGAILGTIYPPSETLNERVNRFANAFAWTFWLGFFGSAVFALASVAGTIVWAFCIGFFSYSIASDSMEARRRRTRQELRRSQREAVNRSIANLRRSLETLSSRHSRY